MSLLIDGELVLYGFVGDNYWDAGFTAREVLSALAEHGRGNDLVVRINSGGGYTDDGVAIYNALMAHKGKVTTVVDAMAASAASIIAMAGGERVMRTGSLMMIHDPASITFGTADDHRQTIARLDRLADQMAGIYADRSGDNEQQMRAEMKAELWLTAEEALSRNLITKTEDASSAVSASASAFDYRLYAKAPEPLVALAATNAWSWREAKPKAVASATVQPGAKGDETMPGEQTADAIAAAAATAANDAVAADRKRRQDIMALTEAKGRETLADHLHATTNMSVDEVKAVLATAPIATAEDASGDADAYERSRADAAGLAAPGGDKRAKGKSGLTARIDNHIERAKRA